MKRPYDPDPRRPRREPRKPFMSDEDRLKRLAPVGFYVSLTEWDHKVYKWCGQAGTLDLWETNGPPLDEQDPAGHKVLVLPYKGERIFRSKGGDIHEFEDSLKDEL
jgi:hypothetical protein